MSQLETQMRHRDREMVPRVLVVAMFSLMVLTTAIAAFAVYTDQPKVGQVPDSAVVQSAQIILHPEAGGIYSVVAPDGTALGLSSDARDGFVGVIGRLVERTRGGAAADMTRPITVNRHDNGAVSLHDPVTGRTFHLAGYGADNVAAFAQYLN